MNRYDMEMRRGMRDSRNPYGSRGGYVVDGRQMRRMRRMRDRGMHDYNYGYGMEDGRRRRNAKGQYMADRAYEHDMPMYRDYADMPRNSMDYGSFHEERGYKPVEAMGYFTGYYGGGEDYARGRGMNYRDYNADYGDYGESLTREELEHWKKKLMKEVDEKDKHFFETQNIEQKARQMGAEMKGFSAEELALTTLMLYTDYCDTIKKYVGNNMDIYIGLAKDWLTDPDSELKGSERLAVYHDEIVMGGEED